MSRPIYNTTTIPSAWLDLCMPSNNGFKLHMLRRNERWQLGETLHPHLIRLLRFPCARCTLCLWEIHGILATDLFVTAILVGVAVSYYAHIKVVQEYYNPVIDNLPVHAQFEYGSGLLLGKYNMMLAWMLHDLVFVMAYLGRMLSSA